MILVSHYLEPVVLRSLSLSHHLFLKELHELGLLISSGQLHKILVDGHELFHQDNDVFASELEKARGEIWDLYDKLAAYKDHAIFLRVPRWGN